MGILDIFKSKPKASLTITIKSPDYFETTSTHFALQVFLNSVTAEKVVSVGAKLKAIALKGKSNNQDESSLGEAISTDPFVVDFNKTSELGFDLPVDFSPIDSFEIPPENLAVASAEMKAAAATNRTLNYNYTVEIVVKTAEGKEVIASKSLRLVQPNEIRAG